ncbi:MAG: protein-disulfide reductase DsbD family protein, partial [Bradymonadaceae bacterium]
MSTLDALLLAFAGGMILNVMPCVLPVLAVKLTSLAKIGGDSKLRAAGHAAGYTAGISGTMLVLAGAVVLLKSIGTAVGWGFQLQYPRFVAAIGAVFILFALNLFEVFRIPALATAGADGPDSGFGRSFFEGVVAVLVSTPCTAPFMGAAVGFALTSSPLVITGVLLALGLGLASPFVVVALVPAARRLLPDPGSWMVVVERVLGFVLLGAALWLVWLYGRLTTLWSTTLFLGFLLATAFAAWGIGRLQPLRSKPRRAALAALLLTVPLGVGWYAFAGDLDRASPPSVVAPDDAERTNETSTNGATKTAASGAGEELSIDWTTWSEERVDRRLEAGRPVFVDFTADWCISCKVNEREVLTTKPVVRAARRNDVVMMKADMTKPDEAILSKLKEFGRAGVPLYLLYSPDRPEQPRVLPQQLEIETAAF